MLSKQEISHALHGPVKMVDVPEWGGEVGIRKLIASDMMFLRGLSEREPKLDDLAVTCELLSLAICDAEGKRIFTPEELREWDGDQMGVICRLIAETQSHNGIGEAATEEIRKNSESGPTSDFT